MLQRKVDENWSAKTAALVNSGAAEGVAHIVYKCAALYDRVKVVTDMLKSYKIQKPAELAAAPRPREWQSASATFSLPR